jgi:hypothetical protein
MLYSIATVCLSGTLREKIEAIAAARAPGGQLNPYPAAEK